MQSACLQVDLLMAQSLGPIAGLSPPIEDLQAMIAAMSSVPLPEPLLRNILEEDEQWSRAPGLHEGGTTTFTKGR
ncbi:uncharacterized protein LAESUDRAFT_728195 [Laetiporus sulphureus 93-53]|uniref:Uncharacterized protein n=1 Tax=Laetiporus sulphureus 93-53 TaxID=1314785 RepID=A0A165D927_9APHY|nr:uncharacterized protein LAESUDRAFT_728195 [Laetiporus sulphureus 93-53]KZT04360.1 hypothetical protein LAESUDRAFT_728195 [Laetiporus sulphureus 93-53]